jgi:F-type H+-transporting ATPase subunit c
MRLEMWFMKRLLVTAVSVLSGLMLSSLALAQEAGVTSGAPSNLIPIGAAIAIGLAAFGAATGQGRAVGSALEGMSRNPGAKDAMFQPLILGLVFMEFQALLGFVIAIIWTFK